MTTEKVAEINHLIKKVNEIGVGLYVQGDQGSIVARPGNLLTDELRAEIKEKRKDIYTYLILHDLRKLLQLIEMAGVLDSVPMGLQEDWASAIISARRSAGDIWENDTSPLT